MAFFRDHQAGGIPVPSPIPIQRRDVDDHRASVLMNPLGGCTNRGGGVVGQRSQFAVVVHLVSPPGGRILPEFEHGLRELPAGLDVAVSRTGQFELEEVLAQVETDRADLGDIGA